MNHSTLAPRWIGFALLGLALGACSAEPGSDTAGGDVERTASSDPSQIVIENEEALNPIARVDLPGVGSVRFYEPAPGHIVIGQGGLATVRLLGPEMAHMTAVEKYRYVARASAPQALIDAEKRAAELGIEPPGAIEQEVRDPSSQIEPQASPELRDKNHTGDPFLDDFCDMHLQMNADLEAFWVFRTGTGGFTWTRLDVVQSAARSRVGTIRFGARVKTCAICSWGPWSRIHLSNGQAWIWSYEEGLNFQFESRVDEADGDTYDYCSFGNR
jgi:hypothetical protein